MKRLIGVSLGYSFFLSLAVAVARQIPYEGSMYVGWKNMQFQAWEAGDFWAWIFIWMGIEGTLLAGAGILRRISWKRFVFSAEKARDEGGKITFWITFGLLLLAWGLLFLAYLPGTGFVDSYLILQNGIRMSRQHPWFYNLLLWGWGQMGEALFGNINLGLMGYSVFQMIILAAAVAGCAAWLRLRGGSPKVVWTIRFYYTVLPVFALYSFSAIKDSLFAVPFLLLIPLLWEMVQSRGDVWGKRWFRLAYLGCCAWMILMRNNGLYIVLALTLVLGLMYRSRWKTVVWVALLPVIICSLLPSLGLKMMGKEAYFQEAVAIPLQQMTAVVAHEGKLTEEQRTFLEQLLPVDQMKAQYYPMNADLIKWDEDFDRDYLQAHKQEFLQHWMSMGLANPSLYVEAYLMQTYTFWSPHPVLAKEVGYAAPLSHEALKLVPDSLFPDTWTQRIHAWGNAQNRFLSPGVMVWMIFGFVVLLWGVRKGRFGVIYLPQILLWGTLMISVPVAESFRYVFPVALALPFSLTGFFLTVKVP